MALNIAFNYSGRAEIIDAARAIIAAGVPPHQIDEERFGEQRTSNFLLWQGAYAELVFTPTLWPDFGEADLDAAIGEFAQRQRRYGA